MTTDFVDGIDRRTLSTALAKPVDAASLACFRIAFGFVLAVDALKYLAFPTYHDTLAESVGYRPTFQLLEFTQDWPTLPVDGILFALALAAVGLMLGWATRLCALTVAASFTWVFVLDPTRFNNHEYLIVLLALWFAIVRSDAAFSVNAARNPTRTEPRIPNWHLQIFVAHFCLVYFYGGLAKFHYDWLRGEPMRIWLAVEQDAFLVGPWLAHPWAGILFSYAGIVFDLTIPFLLLSRITRPVAIAMTFAFHLTNSWLFLIGPFPWLMMAANVVFLEPGTPRRWISKATAGFARELPAENHAPPRRVSSGWQLALVAYAAFHLLMPFRHLVYSSHVDWTEEGKSFAWRMMLVHKESFASLRIVDRKTGNVIEVDYSAHLTGRQRRGKGVFGNPRLLAQYARWLKKQAVNAGVEDPAVYALCLCSMNGRPYQILVDPTVDLASAERPWWRTPDWMIDLEPGQPLGNYARTEEDERRKIDDAIRKYQQQFVPEQSTTKLDMVRR